MGASCGKHRQYEKFSTSGKINFEKLKTGDLILFSDNWSSSKVKRKIRVVNGRLWTSGGIVINAPELFGSEPMLLEYQRKYPDDMLQNQLSMQVVKSGVRLVSLVGRMKQPTYTACMIRRLHPGYKEQIDQTHARVAAAMIRGIKDAQFNSPAHMIFNSLYNTGLFQRAEINRPTLSDCATPVIDSYRNSGVLYEKGKIYQLK